MKLSVSVTAIVLLYGVCSTTNALICDNDLEIPNSFLCDGYDDCANGEDELPPHCDCPFRNDQKVLRYGYTGCKKPCTLESDCRGLKKKCICDGYCGKSCVSPTSLCGKPTLIPQSVSYSIRRQNQNNPLKWDVIDHDSEFYFKDRLTFECEPGRKYFAATSWCTSKRIWSNNTRHCALDCEARNEFVAQLHGIACGQECFQDADCDEGLSCECDGVCGRSCSNLNVDCGEAKQIPHTTIRYKGSHLTEVAFYSCDEGYYRVTGSSDKTCTSSGTWFGEDILCERVICPDPSLSISLTGGGVIYDQHSPTPPYYVGDIVRFVCPEQMKLKGAWERTCMQNGQWSGELTACDTRDSDYNCYHPGYPVGGDMFVVNENSFGVGSEVVFECDEGYIMHGDRAQYCTEFYEWSGEEAPSCIDPKYPTMSSDAITALSDFSVGVERDTQLEAKGKVGRTIYNYAEAGHEIYFIFDTSNSIKEKDFKKVVKFAKRLVERVSSYNGTIKYGIISFSNSGKTELDSSLDNNINSNEKEVIKILDRLENYTQSQLTGNTNTSGALDAFRKQISVNILKNPKRNRNLFVFTDGEHNVGEDPVPQAKTLRGLYHNDAKDLYFDMYSVTACGHCRTTQRKELEGLASSPKNFIYVEDYELLHSYLDAVTDIRVSDECGKMSEKFKKTTLKENKRHLRSKNAWPWQALVTNNFDATKPLVELLTQTGNMKNMIGGGSLIGNKWILTAAHIFHTIETNQPQKILVSLGVYNRSSPSKAAEFFTADKIIRHPNYAKINGDAGDRYDIALIKLGQRYKQLITHSGKGGTILKLIATVNSTLDYSPYVRPVCLPCSSTCFVQQQNMEKTCEEQKNWIRNLHAKPKTAGVIATGFGQYESDDNVGATWLKEMSLKLQSENKCTNGLNRINIHSRAELCHEDEGEDCDTLGINFTDRTFTNHLLCARNKTGVDTCQGDSGGPLIKRIRNPITKKDCFIQIGIVSFGWKCGKAKHEGEVLPGFYTNVEFFLEWIWENTGLNSTMA